jgi:hypothetical protein
MRSSTVLLIVLLVAASLMVIGMVLTTKETPSKRWSEIIGTQIGVIMLFGLVFSPLILVFAMEYTASGP